VEHLLRRPNEEEEAVGFGQGDAASGIVEPGGALKNHYESLPHPIQHLRTVCVCVCVCGVCVRAFVRACVRACVYVCM